MPKKQKKRIKIGTGLHRMISGAAPYLAIGGLCFVVLGSVSKAYSLAKEKRDREEERNAQVEKETKTLKERGQIRVRLRSSIEKDVEAARQYKLNGSTYILESPNQVVMKDGEYKFTLQFNANLLAVDGPDEAQDKQGDTFFLFEEFENANIISDGRKAGLMIAAQSEGMLTQNLDEEELAFMEEDHGYATQAKEDLVAFKKDAAGFSQNYGAQAPSQNTP